MSAGDDSFNAFWQHYLSHHALEGTRLLHVLGTGLASVALVVAIIAINPLIALAGTVLGYLLAWTGHFLVERNRPAMVSHPAWAFLCDVRMFRLWITGQLKSELAKANVG